jgi:hypothetical protein
LYTLLISARSRTNRVLDHAFEFLDQVYVPSPNPSRRRDFTRFGVRLKRTQRKPNQPRGLFGTDADLVASKFDRGCLRHTKILRWKAKRRAIGSFRLRIDGLFSSLYQCGKLSIFSAAIRDSLVKIPKLMGNGREIIERNYTASNV